MTEHYSTLVADDDMGDPIIRLSEVLRTTGLSRSTLYDLVRKGTFPAPLRISPRVSGWLTSEIKVWKRGLIDARSSRANAA